MQGRELERQWEYIKAMNNGMTICRESNLHENQQAIIYIKNNTLSIYLSSCCNHAAVIVTNITEYSESKLKLRYIMDLMWKFFLEK